MFFIISGVAIIIGASILGCAISSWVMNRLWGDDENES